MHKKNESFAEIISALLAANQTPIASDVLLDYWIAMQGIPNDEILRCVVFALRNLRFLPSPQTLRLMVSLTTDSKATENASH